MFCCLTGLQLISDYRFAAVMFNDLMISANSLDHALMRCPWQVKPCRIIQHVCMILTDGQLKTKEMYRERKNTVEQAEAGIQVSNWHKVPSSSLWMQSIWLHCTLWSPGHWDLITEHNCTVVNRERQILFCGSCLNCVMNHTYNVCRFTKDNFPSQ